MIRTPILNAPLISNGAQAKPAKPAAIAAQQLGGGGMGHQAFGQVLADIMMTRQDRPRTISSGRQEFPRLAGTPGDSHLNGLMLRSALTRAASRLPTAPREANSGSGKSEAERLFSSSSRGGGRRPDPSTYDPYIKAAAQQHQVPEDLVRAVIKVESNYNPQATSHAGAMGLMQLMPGTARDLGVSRPYDPQQNIQGGTKYLREMLDRYNGSVPLAVAAYNCGPGNVDKGRFPRETRNYLQLVSRLYNSQKTLPKPRPIPNVQAFTPETSTSQT